MSTDTARSGMPLSKRESEVLFHIAHGKTCKEIARTLKVSEQTAKNHTSNLLIKLGASCRAHAVTLGILKGYLHISPEGFEADVSEEQRLLDDVHVLVRHAEQFAHHIEARTLASHHN